MNSSSFTTSSIYYIYSFESINENTFVEICSYLDYLNIGKCYLVCQSWHQLIESSKMIWKKMIQNLYYNHWQQILLDTSDPHIHQYHHDHYFHSQILWKQFYEDFLGHIRSVRHAAVATAVSGTIGASPASSNLFSPYRGVVAGGGGGDGINWKDCFLQTLFIIQHYFHPPPVTIAAPPTPIAPIAPVVMEEGTVNEQPVVAVPPAPTSPTIPTAMPTTGPSTTGLQNSNNQTPQSNPATGLFHPTPTPTVATPAPCELLNAQLIPLTPPNTLVDRGGHTCHVLTSPSSGEDFLIILGGDIPIEYGEMSTADVISLKTREILYTNLLLLPTPITSSWLNCSVKINNKIYLVQHTENATQVIKISLGKRRFLDSKLLQDEFPTTPPTTLFPEPNHLIQHQSNDLTQHKPQHPLRGSSIVLDPIPLANANGADRYRCIMFGGELDDEEGSNQRFINDIYQLIIDESKPDTVEWQKIIPTGERPCPRAAHSVQLIGRNLFLFGGWTTTAMSTPKQREMATTVFDDVFLNDLYILNIDIFHWRKVETAGIPPVPRCQCAVFPMPNFTRRRYDPLLPSEQTTSNNSRLMRTTQSRANPFEDSRYLIVVGGGSREPQNGGILIHNFSDYNILDLETMCWIPINYHDERLRSGCKAITFYEGNQNNYRQNSNAIQVEAGWILSGGIVSHLLEPEDDATLISDIFLLKLFQ